MPNGPEGSGDRDVIGQTFSDRLAMAHSDRERMELWQGHLGNNAGQIEADTEIAGQLILDGDLEGLSAHLSRHAPERAAARIRKMHAEEETPTEPPQFGC